MSLWLESFHPSGSSLSTSLVSCCWFLPASLLDRETEHSTGVCEEDEDGMVVCRVDLVDGVVVLPHAGHLREFGLEMDELVTRNGHEPISNVGGSVGVLGNSAVDANMA
jgi:hypothetical protein